MPGLHAMDAKQTHNVNTTLYNVVRRLFLQCCEKDVPATLPQSKMTMLQCNVPTMLHDNIVGMLYIKCCIYNVATKLWYVPNYNLQGALYSL